MKSFKFKVIEWSLVGKKEREIIVKDKSKQGAAKKIMEIRGNREWDTLLVGEVE